MIDFNFDTESYCLKCGCGEKTRDPRCRGCKCHLEGTNKPIITGIGREKDDPIHDIDYPTEH